MEASFKKNLVQPEYLCSLTKEGLCIDTIHGTGLETAHALPLTQYKNLRATRVSRETSVNVLLLLKVSKKPLRNNSTEARRFWGQVSI